MGRTVLSRASEPQCDSPRADLLERFRNILSGGGYLVAHPDSIAQMVARCPDAADAVEFYPNPAMELDTYTAIPRMDWTMPVGGIA